MNCLYERIEADYLQDFRPVRGLIPATIFKSNAIYRGQLARLSPRQGTDTKKAWMDMFKDIYLARLSPRQGTDTQRCHSKPSFLRLQDFRPVRGLILLIAVRLSLLRIPLLQDFRPVRGLILGNFFFNRFLMFLTCKTFAPSGD